MFNNAMLICFELYPRWVPLKFTISASISLQSVPTAAVRLTSVAEHSYLWSAGLAL